VEQVTSNADLFHTLLAVLALLLASNLGGFVFARFRLPPVIGEIFGGLCLGPTVLGAVAPHVSLALFSSVDRVPQVISMIYNFGSILVLFCSGLALGNLAVGKDRRLSVSVAVLGSVVPVFGGLLFAYFFDMQSYSGGAKNNLALALVTAVAIAVTSLPILTRIFMDLGMLGSRFARICLSSSILDDVLLYVVLAVALSLVSASGENSFGLLPTVLAGSTLWVQLLAISVVNLGFMLASASLSPRVLRRIEDFLWSWLAVRSPVAYFLVLLVGIVVVCLLIGIPIVLGAFCAGLIAAKSERGGAATHDAIQRFSQGFFVPIYFAIVGFRIDLLKDFEISFFLLFMVFAVVIKGISVYWGGRLGGADRELALDLAVVLNARGGPGIIVASVAFDAGIIDVRFYTTLVLLAIVTSLFAGMYLAYRKNPGREPESMIAV
jgi:Kef-type K+ transport system membrane component KefB